MRLAAKGLTIGSIGPLRKNEKSRTDLKFKESVIQTDAIR